MNCTLGFGKLPELFFFKNGTENVDLLGLRIFPYVFIIMSLVPVILAIISIINQFTVFKVIILLLLLLLSLKSGIARKSLFSKMNE